MCRNANFQTFLLEFFGPSNKWTEGCIDGQTNGTINGKLDGQMDRRKDTTIHGVEQKDRVET